MGKKIIFVGPAGAGKTTLRKIFFEGESSTKLLEYALEPTFGEESLILRLPGLSENIGIFDLAGQENDRWLETDERSIFHNTKVILVVIDLTHTSEEIIDFISKIIDLRNKITPSSYTFVLLHKRDLVSEKKIREIKYFTKKHFVDEMQINFLYTSVKREYFSQTFSYFINILKVCFDDVLPEEGLLLNMVEESLRVIQQIDKEVVITQEIISKKLNRPENLVKYIVQNLKDKGHIENEIIENKELLSLTNKGKEIYEKILDNFTSASVDAVTINSVLNKEIKEKMPPIIGAIIADKDGRSLLKFELFNDALKKFITKSIPNDETIIPVEIDLIPMFISALEKFSLELNIQDLAGFGLKGRNLKMHIFTYEDFTITVFMNPNINLKAIENQINRYFENIFKDYKEKFDRGLRTGMLDDLLEIEDIGRTWLIELNKSYQNMIINSEIIDQEHAQVLYDEIDVLYDDINEEFSVTLEKVKKLKVSLMKAILEKDYIELKKIASIAQDLQAKFFT